MIFYNHSYVSQTVPRDFDDIKSLNNFLRDYCSALQWSINETS